MIHSSRRLTVREVAWEARISKTTCHEILTENLGMHRVDVSREFVNRANTDENFLKNVVTGDGTWVYGYDVKTNAESSHWASKTSPRPKKAQQVSSV